MEPDQDIRTLVEKSTRGDSGSCRELYEHLVDKVYPFVRYRTGTETDATDITQDVFIDLFSTLSQFTYRSRAQFYAYVFVITRRKLARHYGDLHLKREREVQGFDEDTMSESSKDHSHELRIDVERALATLEETTREILVLHHFSRYTFGEIALLVDMTESAVRVRHHRALSQLAEKLEK
jgi:RNA polymerase sigma-70 factor (ECF subfamily)